MRIDPSHTAVDVTLQTGVRYVAQIRGKLKRLRESIAVLLGKETCQISSLRAAFDRVFAVLRVAFEIRFCKLVEMV
jgi:hypothetical protein